MTFEYFKNFFNWTTATTTAVNNKTTTCPTKANICESSDNSGAGSKKSSCFLKASGIIENKFPATVTLNNSTHLYSTALKRKVRKTSRRKWKRRRNGCLHNSTVNMADNIQGLITKTTASELAVALATAPITASSHKCRITVNNTRTTNLNSYINKYKKKIHNYKQRKYFCKHIQNLKSIRNGCFNHTISRSSCCDASCCSNYCNCGCTRSRKKISLIVKNIASLLLQQTILVSTVPKKIAHATTISSDKNYFVNKNKSKNVQLHMKRERLQQLKKLYDLEVYIMKTKTKQMQQHEFHETTKKLLKNPSSSTTTTTICTSSSALTASSSSASPAISTTDIPTKQQASSSLSSLSSSPSFVLSSSSSFLSTTNYSNNSFSTLLPKCKKSTSRTNFTRYYARFQPPAVASSAFSTWRSIICPAPARALNELYGVIFMTLLVLSICHNNVLETSAASVKISKRDVVASSVAAEQNIIPNEIAATAIRLNERQFKWQHPPVRGAQPQQHQQQLPETNNNNHHHQPQTYLNEEIVQQQQPLERKIEEDKSNHIFQAQSRHKTWLTYEQQKQDQQEQQQHQQQTQQQQLHLTTQATSFNQDMALETAFNNTFQSLSIIDGDLEVAIDTRKNLMTVEEEMLVAASGGAVGVGSNAVGLSNNLHNDNNGFGSYNSAMGLDGFDLMADNVEKSSMPIFDFGMPRNITARTGHTEAIIKCRVDRLDDKSVSWIRKRDLHILTVGTATYTSDKRFQVTESKDSREWTLHVKSPQARDSGIYECQVNTEPKMSMAFQLNVIEISPDAKAVITGPADLHFKVGSAIILTCIVHQPSVKDIGPIYWYRGEYMITPFDINENTHEESAFSLTGVAPAPPPRPPPSQTMPNDVNGAEQNHYLPSNGLTNGGVISAVVGTDTEQMPQILTNEITQDFAQRIAMESQLGDTMKSRLRISNAQTSDTGNYTCQPTTASSASVMVHVINDENPAAMQKSRANSSLFKRKEQLLMHLFSAIIIAATVASFPASIFKIVCSLQIQKHIRVMLATTFPAGYHQQL